MKHTFRYKSLLLITVLAAAFVFTACGSGGSQAVQEASAAVQTESPANETQEASGEAAPVTAENTESAPAASTGEKVFTPEELAQYNGQDGMPAYVAVDGVVYDVSDKPLWSGGRHQNLHFAGTDLSEAIGKSPHGKSKLKDLPVVGILAEE